MKLKEIINYVFSFRPQTSRRYAWVDYAKGIAIIFVLYRHVIYGLLYTGANISTIMMETNEILYGFRMPLFFFLSGLFFAASVQKRGPRNFLISKINTLLYPYLLWCFIQVSLQIIFTNYTNHKLTINNYADIFIHPRSMLQLWYLAALFNVSALYLFTSTVLKLRPWMQITLGVVLLGMKSYAGDISTISDVMLYYIYFVFGHLAVPYFFSEKLQQQLASPLKAILLLPVFLGVQYYCMSHENMSLYLFSLLAMLGGLLVIMIAFILAKYEKLKILQTLGHYSLYIYLLHLGIIFLLRVAILKTGILTNVPVICFILVLAGLFGSIILYRFCLLMRMKFLFTGPFKERPLATSSMPVS
ncbi:acyltransferase family protein [Chitinophaga qingshengii]|uniref:Acyltransferase n=1 Tax=Chitinophaga qingshengii TaxID=1569794 RepID=A0ABR7TET0_9BACT|nr:acyltransferase [Chitinophaga qingshengii]MBC9928791.1 acyltransferase [Chitinophaga qingshengii]